MKLDRDSAREIRLCYFELEIPLLTIATQFGVAPLTVVNILTNKTWKAAPGDPEPRFKLTRDLAEEIRGRILEGETAVALAREFRVSKATISNIINNRVYKTATSARLSHKYELRRNRLTPEDAADIRRDWGSGRYRLKDLSEYYRVSVDHIFRIVHNRAHYDPNYTPPSRRARSRSGAEAAAGPSPSEITNP